MDHDENFNLTKVAIFISTGMDENHLILSISTSLLTYWYSKGLSLILKKWFKISWLPQETREFSTGLRLVIAGVKIKQNKGLFVDQTPHAGGNVTHKNKFFNWFDNGTPVPDIR